MASVGPQSPTAAANDGGTGIPWNNPTNILSPDGSYASVSLTNVFPVTEGLQATGFDFSAIPDGATISGVVVEVLRSCTTTSGSPRDSVIRLLKSSTPSGNNKATGTTWPTTDAYATYGGAADLWGTTLTAAEVKNSGFGVAVAAQTSGGKYSTTVRLDHVRITVYYTAATDYTLDADPGTFTVTGTDAAVTVSRGLNAAAGSFIATGATAGMVVSRGFDAGAGAFTVTGADAEFAVTLVGGGNTPPRGKIGLGIGLGL